MTGRNVELLERVMQHIDDHPAQHDQEVWLDECGTAACFAGWACLLSGWQVGAVDNSMTIPTATVFSPDGLQELGVGTTARDLLGLTTDEAAQLFNSMNTRDELRLMVKDLVNGDQLRNVAQYIHEAGAL